MIWDVNNKTNEELEQLKNYNEEKLNQLTTKIKLYGKVLGETDIHTICSIVAVMHEDTSMYDYTLSQINEAYDELERRRKEDKNV